MCISVQIIYCVYASGMRDEICEYGMHCVYRIVFVYHGNIRTDAHIDVWN